MNHPGWLFVPADERAKADKAFTRTSAQVILDLEDGIGASPARREAGLALIGELALAQPAWRARCWVRLGPLDPQADLAAAVHAGAAGVLLPKCEGPEPLLELAAAIDRLEAALPQQRAPTRIVAIPTETARGVQRLADLRTPLPRLHGLMWGAEDLCADLGGTDPRDAQGLYLPPYMLARDACLLAARAAECLAIDAVYVAYHDAEGLAREARAHRQLGFDAKAAIHPAQLPLIEQCFGPSEAQRAWAERVLAAVPQGGGAATVDGAMVDAPHRRRALRLLGRRGTA